MRLEDIQKLGAQAAREGLTLFDCPYFRAKALPGYTGESIQSWKLKVDAWELGWQVETDNRLARADRKAIVRASSASH
ncbi:MAG: hypothetical protein J0I68_30300 [Achromobacter sp.]|uniref:CrpP-related protein n=1 Tax=unclassified Achromobacter TaxID=2626865 RepID=UPI0006C52E3F|nr:MULTISPECIES: CrpP-related protein [unclassified Achromobacter]MBN9642855.1 hypothetical protein [Achromobacter sp.]CUJ62123.1 Uncharacterised protein [Achromobacter sp. 2789STDY5608621]